MFNAAGILFGCFGVYAYRYELFCKKAMLFINLFGKLQSYFCQGKCTVRFFDNMTGLG